MSALMNSVVLVSNHVASGATSDDNFLCQEDTGRAGDVVFTAHGETTGPQLGRAWAHFVNSRFLLARMFGNYDDGDATNFGSEKIQQLQHDQADLLNIENSRSTKLTIAKSAISAPATFRIHITPTTLHMQSIVPN